MVSGYGLVIFAVSAHACGNAGDSSSSRTSGPDSSARGGQAGTSSGGGAAKNGGASSGGASGRDGTGGAAASSSAGTTTRPPDGGASAGVGGDAGASGHAPAQVCASESAITYAFGMAATCAGEAERDPTVVRYADQVHSVYSAQPLRAGEPVSITFTGQTSCSLEIWGTDKTCGEAQELLWKGATFENPCAQFTPQADYQELLLIWRAFGESCGRSLGSELAVCHGGACAVPPDALPIPLVTDLSADSRRTTQSLLFMLGTSGRMYLLNRLGIDDTTPSKAGLFRGASPLMQYGDAWYCTTSGTVTDDDSSHRASVNLKGLSRLPECKPGSHSLSLEVVGGSAPAAESTSSLSGLTLSGKRGGTWTDQRSSYNLTTQTESVWFDFVAADSLSIQPQQALLDAWVVRLPLPDGPPQFACGSVGTADVSNPADVKFTIDNLSDWITCPGTAVTPSELTLQLNY